MLPHYSAFKVAEQFRVLDAIAPGPHRPGARPRAGLGRAHRFRAQPAGQRAPGAVSRRRARPDGLGDGRGAARGPPVRGRARLSRRRDGARDLDARQLRLRRAGGGALRAALRVRLVLHRRRRRRAGARPLPQALQAERAPSRAAHGAVRVGAGGGDRGGGAVPLLLARPLPPAARPRHLLGARAARPRRWRTPTRRASLPASPSSAKPPSSAPARRSPSASTSWPAGSTCRRWPS